MSFRNEPIGAKVYISIITLSSLIFLFFNMPDFSLYREMIFFAVLRIVLEQLDVPLPRGNGAVSVSFALDLALLVLFGPAVAAWVCLTTLFYKDMIKDARKYFHKMVFNTAQLSLSAGLAGYAFVLMRGASDDIVLLADIFPIIISALIYFLVNSLLVMTVITLSQKKSFLGVWLTNFRWAIPNYFATLPLGVLIAAVYQNMYAEGVLLMIIPLIVARHTFLMYIDMRNQYLSTIKALTKTIDAKDNYTHGHSERVAKYSVMIGYELRLPEDYLEKLEYLALMHDIGKIGIPEQILNKPGHLSDEEFEVISSHSAVGADIISSIKFIGEHANIVRHHHERMDGSGYPDGLRGEELPLGARIVGVADAFDAMTSVRVYKEPKTTREGVKELLRCSGTQFCPKVVKAFIRALQRKGEI